MQQKLDNKTKEDSIITMKSTNQAILEKSVSKSHIKTDIMDIEDANEKIINEFLKNGSEPWGDFEETSIYESLIESVISNNRYLGLLAEMLHDLHMVVESLRTQLSRMIIFVTSEKKDKSKDIENLKERLEVMFERNLACGTCPGAISCGTGNFLIAYY